ncbi:hypothetical protein [Formivibrio citricus]|uniref:hypothetical protein n=1 Tax=Formivibrio citricus TaxID=83765 RepID=UPI000B85E163|nr:hypothetical protein [Formivibrio citricus]
MDFKAQSAPQYGYCKRFATQKAARNTPNPKGWAGKTPFTALCALKITGYCLRRMPCDWHFPDPAQICNQRQQNLALAALRGLHPLPHILAMADDFFIPSASAEEAERDPGSRPTEGSPEGRKAGSLSFGFFSW